MKEKKPVLLTDNLSPEAANWPAHSQYSRVVVRNSQRAGARLLRVSVAALPPVVNALSRKKTMRYPGASSCSHASNQITPKIQLENVKTIKYPFLWAHEIIGCTN